MKKNYTFTGSTYHLNKSWEENYQKGPNFKGEIPPFPKIGKWSFLGKKLVSPLGVAAGPLPNSKWVTPYAKLGYGSVVFKTVRSSPHKTHPYPNIVHLNVSGAKDVRSGKKITGDLNFPGDVSKLSISNSFGNPCFEPKEWLAEAKKSRSATKPGQLFGISVYGTAEDSTTLKELAADYAKTARMANSAKPDFIEINLACPNVKGSENPNLYKDPEAVKVITLATKKAIGKTPLVLKVGFFDSYKNLLEVLKPTKGHFEAISAINTISRKVSGPKGEQILPGRDESGVCGFAIKEFGIKTVKNLVKAKKDLKMNFEIIGVGGVMAPKDVKDYLKAGANHVHSATAIMFNPYLAYELGQGLS